MAIILDAAQVAAAMLKGSSELKFLFGKEEVPDVLQAKFFHIGIVSVAKFAALVKNADDLRKVLKDNMEIDVDADLAHRVIAASVLVAFERASQRSSKLAEFEAELEVRRLPKPLENSEYLAMKAAWESKYWKLEDIDLPGRTYLERRLEELESGDLRAEPLQLVLSREGDDLDYLQPMWDTSGLLKVRKQGATVPEPTNPEQLRRRLALSFTGIMFMAFRHTNRLTIQGVTPQLVQSYCEYLLGEYVWGLVAKDAEGRTISTPSWDLVLAYDLAIRRKTFRLMADGKGDFTDSLKLAMDDPTTKERHFTTPMAISAVARNKGGGAVMSYSNHVEHEVFFEQKGSPGKGNSKKKGSGRQGGSKGKGGGKAKGSSSKGSGKGANQTPDGRSICFNYNNAEIRCRRPDCRFLHVCTKCFQRHPAYQCRGQAQAPYASVPASETQGGGAGSA